jgi:hypothetical protein
MIQCPGEAPSFSEVIERIKMLNSIRVLIICSNFLYWVRDVDREDRLYSFDESSRQVTLPDDKVNSESIKAIPHVPPTSVQIGEDYFTIRSPPSMAA